MLNPIKPENIKKKLADHKFLLVQVNMKKSVKKLTVF